MQRYFIDEGQVTQTKATISGDDFHHLKRVMRAKLGQKIIVCLPNHKAYESEIIDIGETVITVAMISELNQRVELPVEVTLIQGLPKGDKLEYIVQKSTELGVSHIIPWSAKRSIVKLDVKKSSKKVERWQKIAKEAAEQAHRITVPTIYDVQTTPQVIESLSGYDHIIIAFEETAKSGQHAMFKQILMKVKSGQKIAVIIGPEGGLTEEEVANFTKFGVAASFGPRILRTETASSYALSAMSYQLEL